MADARTVSHRALAVLVGIAILERIPPLLSGPLGYDDGVYTASVAAMRKGALPYREVFSSQGPAFLPLARVFDVLGFQTSESPRLVSAVAGIALVLATYALARRVMGEVGAVAAAALVVFSPLILDSTGPLSADGIALAFATYAVAVAAGPARAAEGAHRAKSGTSSWIWVGVLMGLAFAVKGPIVAGPGVAALLLVWRRNGIARALGVVPVAILVVTALSTPWGLHNVWRQFVTFHGRAESISASSSLRIVAQALFTVELPLVLFAAAAVWVTTRRLHAPGLRGLAATPEGDVLAAALLWLGLETVLLLVHTPVFSHLVIYLLVPLALLVGYAVAHVDRQVRLAVVVSVIAAAWLVGHSPGLLWPSHATGSERAAIHDMRADVPATAEVVSDQQYLVYWAGRQTTPNLVDTSLVRIRAGYLTLQDVRRGAEEPQVCAVLIWSGRFALLGNLAAALPDYHQVHSYGPGRVLLLRTTCSPPAKD